MPNLYRVQHHGRDLLGHSMMSHTMPWLGSIFFPMHKILVSHQNLPFFCHNPTWKSVRMRLTLPKFGTWESSGTSKTSEFDFGGQNTLHLSVLYIIGKLLKCKCRKWPHMGHLDICSTSYGKKKGQESNY